MNAEKDLMSAMFILKQNKGRGQSARAPTKNNDELKNVKCFNCDKLGHCKKWQKVAKCQEGKQRRFKVC